MIYDTHVVQESNSGEFRTAVNTAIMHYQGEGLKVEVQFSTSMSAMGVVYSALIIARVA